MRHLRLLTLILLFVLTCTASLKAEEQTSILDRQTALSLIDENGHADIPEIYTEIGFEAFYKSNLLSVNIPNSIVTIDGGAFAHTGIERIDVPGSVKYIKEYAFSNPQKTLQTITLPSSLEEIGILVFEHVEGEIYLTQPINQKITIDDFPSNTTIFSCESRDGDDNPFNCQTAFTETTRTKLDRPAAALLIDENGNAVVPNSIKTIGKFAFMQTNVLSVMLPETIETIETEAFYQTNLEQINLPATLTNIQQGAFAATSLKEVSLPPLVTTLERYLFADTNITNIHIPNSLAVVQLEAFKNTNIKALYLPNIDIELEDRAFNTVKTIYVPEPVDESFNLNAFHDDVLIIVCDSSTNDAQTCPDIDQDGVINAMDKFPLAPEYQSDTDLDGMPDQWEELYGLNPEDASDKNSDGDNDGIEAIDEFLNHSAPIGSIDLDGNGSFDALTDGLILLRYFFGLRAEPLVNAAISSNARFTTHTAIQTRIDSISEYIDIDNNGAHDALTDGLIILRYLFGLRSNPLVSGAISPNASRTSAEAIEQHLVSLKPSDLDNDGVYDLFDLYPNNPLEIANNDGDELGNHADLDDDNDGFLDTVDVFPFDAAENIDSDNDGIGNNADNDDDNDGIADTSDAYATDPTKHKAQVWGESDWGKTSWKPNNSGFTWGESTWSE